MRVERLDQRLDQPVDLRSTGLAAVAWASVLMATEPWWWSAVGIGAGLGAVVVRRRRRGDWTTAAAWLLVGVACAGSAALHTEAVALSPVHALAARGAPVTALVRIGSDPVRTHGRFGSGTSAVGEVVELEEGGRVRHLGASVQLLLPGSAGTVVRGSTVEVGGALAPAFRPELAATLRVRGRVHRVSAPGPLTSWANGLRAGVRDAVAGRPESARALVPALVDGQDGDVPPRVVADFRTAGLTHLMAVSGTNLTLIVGCLLLLARWTGVRGRALIGVGMLGVAGFLLLAGSEPSVLRAAAMGSIGLLGLGSAGTQRGVRALGVGVVALLVLDPWLARSVGFALSAAATAGILLLAPRWRDALARWMPRWAAEVVAVPLAAQVACTPLVAGISGQVSLVAVAANLLAAPLVGPATVLGLLGGLVDLASADLGRVVAMPAAWCAQGLVVIAEHAAGLPLAALDWSSGPVAQVGLLVGCCATALTLHRLLAQRAATLLAAGLLAVAVLVPLPTPGWPPGRWTLVVCSVGQGDAMAIRVADHAAVVVDAGPDPRLVDRCLARLAITAVPVVVLTHFHADHVDGLAGVLHGRQVGEIRTTSLAEPASGALAVARTAARAGVPVRQVVVGEQTTIGGVSWQTLAPLRTDYPDSDSPPNDASVVVLLKVGGVRMLLMGDEERPSQADLRRTYPDLRADVLKVAHHGSSKQDEQLIDALGARVAVISVGLDNDYGHPAASTLGLLARAGLQVHRTDLEGDVAVVVDEAGRLGVVTHRTPS